MQEDQIDLRERHRRYETLRREQLGYTLNLTFGLAAASVGFCAAYIVNKDSVFSCPGTCFFLVATGAFIFAVGFGLFANYTRLKDFRLTAKTLKLKVEKLEEKDAQKIEGFKIRISKYDNDTKCLGKWTWRLFYAQQFAFGIAVILLVTALLLLHHSRLFPITKG